MSFDADQQAQFVNWFRASSPYIHAHRGKTCVVTFGGELVESDQFAPLGHDLALLHSLGIRLVLVHGSRPQIDQRLSDRNHDAQFHEGVRITDDTALACVKEAAGQLRVEIEALLSMGLANTPSGGARVQVTTGNFIVARPLGVRDGVDFCHTGEVRRIDAAAIQQQLQQDNVVLLSPIGYSPTGEVFNLSCEELAAQVATALSAEKLISLIEPPGIPSSQEKDDSKLTPRQAEAWLERSNDLDPRIQRHLRAAISACRFGVRRAHLVDRSLEGGLLLELFTRDGIGTLITDEAYEGIRQAHIDDVGGLLSLIEPLENEGVLVRRSRELLEMEIDHYTVAERDGMIVACVALYPFERAAELACVAVHPDYRKSGRGDALLEHVERVAKKSGTEQIFVLTTRSAHWFQERGFVIANVDDLPVARRSLYNYQRNSKVLTKRLD